MWVNISRSQKTKYFKRLSNNLRKRNNKKEIERRLFLFPRGVKIEAKTNSIILVYWGPYKIPLHFCIANKMCVSIWFLN